MKYDKSQTSWLVIVVFLSVILIISVAFFRQAGEKPLPENVYYTLLGIFISVLLFFYKLRIKVDERGIHIIYGIGLIRIRIHPDEINNVKEVKSSFLYGWGIRFIPGGMLYNIQGLKTVEISYFNKKNEIVRIGSADCDNLIAAIKERYHLL